MIKGMCPICLLKMTYGLMFDGGTIPAIYNNDEQNYGVALTPPMGWSTWNTFGYRIDQDLIYETALAFKEKGLLDVGYQYLNIDDCWQDKTRDIRGELVEDPIRFSDGIPALVQKVNALGIKMGIYTDNGTMTCCDYPGTTEEKYYRDAYTFAKWGIEYWKVDYCHSVKYPFAAPLVSGILVGKRGEVGQKYGVEVGKRHKCHIFKIRFPRHIYYTEKPFTHYVRGIDALHGYIEFEHTAPEEGEYVVTVHAFEKKRHERFLGVMINDETLYTQKVPGGRNFKEDYEMHFAVKLKAGVNTIKLFNPIKNPATCNVLQYQQLWRAIRLATEEYAADSGKEHKKIVFSICEGNQANPHLWGKSAGNLWRTTCDIKENWKSIMHNYEHNVQLHEYASIGHWNDPDMLEVGVGDLSYTESESHFALWCMMASPLILGNDIRNMSDEILNLIKNKTLISIDQDGLGKQAKRIVKGDVDILVKPLTEGRTAVCVFNKTERTRSYVIDEDALRKEPYIQYDRRSDTVLDAVREKTVRFDEVSRGELPAKSVLTIIVK